MRVPSRGGWIYRDDDPKMYWALVSLFCVQIGVLVFGLIFYNWAKLKMASAVWPSTAVERDIAAALRIFLPFVGAFLASRLIYGWISKTGRQSADFSPTVASVLTTPLLAFAYLTGSMRVFVAGNMRDLFIMIGKDLVLFGPVFLVLTPLLVTYLRGGFRERRMSGTVLGAAAVGCVILEFVGLYLIFGHTS
jgi:hypothetical protein